MKAQDLKTQLDAVGTQLGNVSDQLTKGFDEIVKDMADLNAKIEAADDIPQDVVDAASALGEKATALSNIAQKLDDIVPDAPTLPPPESPAPHNPTP